MYIETERKYCPQNLGDFVYPNKYVQRVVEAYASGQVIRPLILCGTHGTGKTLLTKLIPNAIEGKEAYVESIDSGELNSKDTVNKVFGNRKSFNKFFTYEGQKLNYIVVQEMNEDIKARNQFRTALDQHQDVNLTIITTNNINKVDTGLRSRCEVLEVPHCPAKVFFPRAKHIINSEGYDIDDAALLAALEAVEAITPDNRAYYKKLDELLREMP
jgi:DNA polymerase III delta prime subunit